LRLRVLGGFRLERDGAPLDLGVKPPTRSLDLLRRLAIANGQTLSLDDVYESLWPDADGDQAKAACEQALHRLRRLLGRTDFLSQREGTLRLLRDRVWVDLDAWQIERDRALRLGPSETALDELERVFWRFSGPLFQGMSEKPWSLLATERVRSELVELATRLGGHWDARGAHEKARTFYARALEFYPASERCYEALLRSRLAESDIAGALEDYHRYERVLHVTRATGPSPALRAIMAPHLPGRRPPDPRVSDT
jgi:LuxR family maltose regulon positive regulatory protein